MFAACHMLGEHPECLASSGTDSATPLDTDHLLNYPTGRTLQKALETSKNSNLFVYLFVSGFSTDEGVTLPIWTASRILS